VYAVSKTVRGGMERAGGWRRVSVVQSQCGWEGGKAGGKGGWEDGMVKVMSGW
jgi:hypothetical protein